MVRKNGTDAMTISAFGRQYSQHFVTLDTALAANRQVAGARQKRMIVLHSTVDNRGGPFWLSSWNNGARPASAHFVVERDAETRFTRTGAFTGIALLALDDRRFSDAVQIAPTTAQTYHSGPIGNTQGIGIEVSNRVDTIANADATNEPSIIGNYADHDGGRAIRLRRPADENRWYRLPSAFRGGSNDLTLPEQQRDFQFWEDVQYGSLILLIRRLCVMHRIPRRMLGVTASEARDMYTQSGGTSVSVKNPSTLRRMRAMVHEFRGIMVHHNVATKPCPGVIHRNRIYRGIIDDWWMPIAVKMRAYYTGPFEMPPFTAGAPTRHGLFHWDGHALGGTVVKTADLGLLYDAESHFDTREIDGYYTRVEHGHGGFPVGTNGAPHGGVHFRVPAGNRGVFAAASGTIVAARLASEPTTETDPQFGSQRFVLIRHAIHIHHEVDPSGAGPEDRRIDYNQVVWVFSLYMHLGPVANLGQEDDHNPPWLNHWFRRNPGVSLTFEGDAGAGTSAMGVKGQVFCPDIEVNVGDLLGTVAGYAGDPDAFHFEIFSGRSTELGSDPAAFGATPWDDTSFRFDDTSNAAQREDLFGPDGEPYLERLWVRRSVKFRGVSEWAFTEEDLVPFVPNERRRALMMIHVDRFNWVADAIAVCPNLAQGDQFGGSDGVFWHYHPVTFMAHMANVIRRESHEFSEHEQIDETLTNVVVDDDGFIVRFVNYDASTSSFQDVAADGRNIRSSQRSDDDRDFSFRRDEVACLQEVAAGTGSTTTKFSFGLLEIIEQFRLFHDEPVTVQSAFLRDPHVIVENCCTGDLAMARRHGDGVAIDVRPRTQTPTHVRRFWENLNAFVAEIEGHLDHACGNAAFGELPANCTGLRVLATPDAVSAKLAAGDALTTAEARSFCAHIELQ